MVDDTLAKAEHLLQVGRTKHARALLGQRLRQEPNDHLALYYLARAAVMEGELSEARDLLERSLGSNPYAAGPRALLFHVDFEQSKYEAAERLVISLIRDNPRDAAYLAMYAKLMLFTGHLPKAEQLAAEAIKIEPKHVEARRVMVLLNTVTGKHRAATETIGALVAEDPQNAALAHTLFYVLVSRGQLEVAERLGQDLLRLDPSNRALVKALVDLRVVSHPMGLPLYPFRKWGWIGSAALWAAVIFGCQVLERYNQPLATAILLTYCFIALYSWVYPPLMRRWLTSRGI